jgi:hypothetical protein
LLIIRPYNCRYFRWWANILIIELAHFYLLRLEETWDKINVKCGGKIIGIR